MAMTIRGDDVSKVVLRTRLTIAEKAQVEESARAHGLTISEFMRRRILGRVAVSIVDSAALRQLSQYAGLVKNTFKQSRGMYDEKTAAALDELTALARAIRQAVERGA